MSPNLGGTERLVRNPDMREGVDGIYKVFSGGISTSSNGPRKGDGIEEWQINILKNMIKIQTIYLEFTTIATGGVSGVLSLRAV